jgi:hypothetical protein
MTTTGYCGKSDCRRDIPMPGTNPPWSVAHREIVRGETFVHVHPVTGEWLDDLQLTVEAHDRELRDAIRDWVRFGKVGPRPT